jgi:hypothetical protein
MIDRWRDRAPSARKKSQIVYCIPFPSFLSQDSRANAIVPGPPTITFEETERGIIRWFIEMDPVRGPPAARSQPALGKAISRGRRILDRRIFWMSPGS